MALHGLGVVQQGERSPVQSPVRAHARAAGSVPGQGMYERQLFDVSLLNLSPPPFPSL